MINAMTADRYAIETCELYREANKYIKSYETKKSLYREALMHGYFNRCEILVCDKGLVIATAKLQEREEFDTKRFKQEHPELYKEYALQRTIQPLLVK